MTSRSYSCRKEMIFVANKKIWKKLLPGLLLIVVSAAAGLTGATVLHNMSLENPIKTPPVEGTFDEPINANIKRTSFKNTSEDADVFLRVSYGESWTTKDGELLPLQFTAADGKTYRVATPVWNSEAYKDWEMGDDGWIYYTHVLKAKESTPVLLYKADFLGSEGSGWTKATMEADPEGSKYLSAKYDIHFTMEIVQASDEWQVSKDAVQELFGKGDVIRENLKAKEKLPNGKDRLNKDEILDWPDAEPWTEPGKTQVVPLDPNADVTDAVTQP